MSFQEWNGHTLVHWWYTPPSYNTWISSDQLPSNKLYGNAKNEKPKWKISNEWLEQSFKFNEWMLEWDYQLNSKGTELSLLSDLWFKNNVFHSYLLRRSIYSPYTTHICRYETIRSR